MSSGDVRGSPSSGAESSRWGPRAVQGTQAGARVPVTPTDAPRSPDACPAWEAYKREQATGVAQPVRARDAEPRNTGMFADHPGDFPPLAPQPGAGAGLCLTAKAAPQRPPGSVAPGGVAGAVGGRGDDAAAAEPLPPRAGAPGPLTAAALAAAPPGAQKEMVGGELYRAIMRIKPETGSEAASKVMDMML